MVVAIVVDTVQATNELLSVLSWTQNPLYKWILFELQSFYIVQPCLLLFEENVVTDIEKERCHTLSLFERRKQLNIIYT